MMGGIYRAAKRCLVWLGEVEGSATELASEEDTNYRPRDGPASPDDLEALEAVYNSVLTFETSKLHWWDRAWVVREIAVAPEVVVCFGPFHLSWGNFCWDLLRVDSSESLKHQRPSSEIYPGLLESSRRFPVRQDMAEAFGRLDLMRARARLYPIELASLELLLGYARRSGCSDPRDKVYSLLSLMSPQAATLLPPTYNIPWAEVLAKGTYASIVTEKNFWIWRLKDADNHGFRSSWAVDLSRTESSDDPTLLTSMTAIGKQREDRGKGWMGGPPDAVDATLSCNAAVLGVMGYAFDDIKDAQILPSYYGLSHRHSVTPEVHTFLQEALCREDLQHAYESV